MGTGERAELFNSDILFQISSSEEFMESLCKSGLDWMSGALK